MSSFSNFINNVANGKLGEVEVTTDIKFDTASVVNLGLTIFVAGALVILAYFAIRKLF